MIQLENLKYSDPYLIFIGLLLVVMIFFLVISLLGYKKEEKPDVQAIAGEDEIATQLDLARAYIEMGKTSSAKAILEDVIKHGSPAKQNEARELISSL